MGAGPDQSLGQLVAGAIADVQTLVKDQIELTKADVSKSVKDFGSSAGMFAGAGVLGLIGFIFLLVTAAYGLEAAGLPTWASFLIVAVVVLIVAGILAFLGKKRIDKGRAITQHAVTSAKETQASIQSGVKSLVPSKSPTAQIPSASSLPELPSGAQGPTAR